MIHATEKLMALLIDVYYHLIKTVLARQGFSQFSFSGVIVLIFVQRPHELINYEIHASILWSRNKRIQEQIGNKHFRLNKLTKCSPIGNMFFYFIMCSRIPKGFKNSSRRTKL